MENDKKKNITKKLQNLVKGRKTPVVIIKQGSVKYASKSSSSTGIESYTSYSYDT